MHPHHPLDAHKTKTGSHVHVIIIICTAAFCCFGFRWCRRGRGTCFIVILQAFFINYSLLLFDKRSAVGATCIFFDSFSFFCDRQRHANKPKAEITVVLLY